MFDDELILMEFKRPSGAAVPSREVCGQVAFATMIKEEFGMKWRLLVLPGPIARMNTDSKKLTRESVAALNEAREHWDYPEKVNDKAREISGDCLESYIVVQSWEEVVSAAMLLQPKRTKWNGQLKMPFAP